MQIKSVTGVIYTELEIHSPDWERAWRDRHMYPLGRYSVNAVKRMCWALDAEAWHEDIEVDEGRGRNRENILSAEWLENAFYAAFGGMAAEGHIEETRSLVEALQYDDDPICQIGACNAALWVALHDFEFGRDVLLDRYTTPHDDIYKVVETAYYRLESLQQWVPEQSEDVATRFQQAQDVRSATRRKS
ncbi:hypothetical protein ACWFPY_25345 [Nocardia fluminea]